MDTITKEKLKNIPKVRCFKCDSKRSYTNPMVRCWECKKKYCFNHIGGGLIKKGMLENEEVRNICDKCKGEKGYKDL